MSRKNKVAKQADWTDAFTGSSTMPTDDFTPSNGTTFGLDSFNFDEQDGAGAEDGARLPETRGLSALPDGLVTAAEAPDDAAMTDDDGIVLSSEDVGLPKEASPVSLEWLDPTQVQDPDRLPDNDATLNSIPQLEEAWGANTRTDGVHLIPGRDRETALYQESIRDGESAGGQTSALTGVKNAADEGAVREAALRAVRRAHFGHPIAKIKEGLVEALGHTASRTKGLVAKLTDEYGLLGRVYIQASAFPGLRNGEWVKEIRRSCRTARYVITDDATVASKLGMKQVSEVPWKAALAHYQPLLTAKGYKVASGDPRSALRQAFLNGPQVEVRESNLPVIQQVVASDEEVQAEMAKFAPQPVVKSAQERDAEALRKAAKVQLARWVKGGLLTRDDAFKLVSAGLEPRAMLRLASARLAQPKVKEYTGPVFETHAASAKEKVINPKEVASLVRWATEQMGKGVKGKALTAQLKARYLPALLTAASPRLKAVRAKYEAGYVEPVSKGSATAAQFNPQEFNLHNAELDEVIAKEQVAPGQVAGLTFGAGPNMGD